MDCRHASSIWAESCDGDRGDRELVSARRQQLLVTEGGYRSEILLIHWIIWGVMRFSHMYSNHPKYETLRKNFMIRICCTTHPPMQYFNTDSRGTRMM